MSKVQFLMFPGHPVKFNSALVLSIEKGEEKGPNIVLNFVDGRVSVIRFTTAEERDAAFDASGSDAIDTVSNWAMNLFNELKPFIETYAENAQKRMEQDLKAEAEYQEWLKDNPPGSPGNPIFKAGPFPSPGVGPVSVKQRSGKSVKKPGAKKTPVKKKTGTKKR